MEVFWWIFRDDSLIKLEKDIEDDNHYSVFQIDIIFSKKYCDLTSIASNEHNTKLWSIFFSILKSEKNVGTFLLNAILKKILFFNDIL